MYKYLALDIFSGKYVQIKCNKQFLKYGTIIKGYQIKERIYE